MSWLRGSFLAAAFAAASLAVASPADAHVKRQGAWPDADKPVTLDLQKTPRDEALRKVADAAGWSLVVKANLPQKLVDLHLKQQPAGKVLDLLLDDEDDDYVAKRDGTLVVIEEDEEGSGNPSDALKGLVIPPIPPIPPVPPVPPVGSVHAAPSSTGVSISIGSDSSEVDEPHARGKDRTVMGGDVRIAKGEIARDITVFGGNVDIEGEATGDVTVFGGNVRVHEGARVHGDATVFGGTLALAPGAKVDGDVSALGGTLKREPGSQIGGDVNAKTSDSDSSDSHDKPRGLVMRAGESIMDGVRLAAVLFVIGTVLLALAGRRMESLRFEVAARPMRTLALGLVGLLGGVVVLIALCVTVIGIPIALVGALLGVLGMFGAMCAVLSVVGEALLRHRTTNQYVHLAVGCALFVALSALPWVGGFVGLITALAGIGTLVATRGAGFFVKRNGGGTPYRSVPPEAPIA
ncbi:MAG TPA: polymer-forming cytoskeletal protein [Polyangiaceae bacterium]|nr:polymer-forming cytoskeletal protein [Polyangiaceae bacterium]